MEKEVTRKGQLKKDIGVDDKMERAMLWLVTWLVVTVQDGGDGRGWGGRGDGFTSPCRYIEPWCSLQQTGADVRRQVDEFQDHTEDMRFASGTLACA